MSRSRAAFDGLRERTGDKHRGKMGDEEDFGEGMPSKLWCCIPIYTTVEGRAEFAIKPRLFKIVATLLLAFVFLSGFAIGWFATTASSSRLVDKATAAALDNYELSAYDKALRSLSDEKRRATLALNSGVKPDQVCMSGASAEDDLILLFNYNDYTTPMPCTCSGQVCIKSNMVVNNGDGNAQQFSNSEDEQTDPYPPW